MDSVKNVYFPKWVALFYGALAVLLVPWIFSLAADLPSRHLAHHWDAVWVGFDAVMLIAEVLTVVFIIKQSVLVVMSATALATLFIVDAWFDILTSQPGREQRLALVFGGLELVLAAMTYRLSFHVFHHSTPQKNVKLSTKD